MLHLLPMNVDFSDKYTFVDSFYTLFFAAYVALLYVDILSNSHIILSDQCPIMNWYCFNLGFHLCTTRGELASEKKIPVNFNHTLWSNIPPGILSGIYKLFTLLNLPIQ